MKLHRLRCRAGFAGLLTVALFWVVPASASLIVGWDNSATPGFPGALDSIDPITGNVTAYDSLAGSQYIAVSSGLSPGSILALSPVNLYSIDVSAHQSSLYAPGNNCSPSCVIPQDLAFDSSGSTAYAIGSEYTVGQENGPRSLYRVTSLVPDPLPQVFDIGYTFVGEIGGGINVMEYIPGFGLYGTNGNAGYGISETTGQATLLAAYTTSLPVTGLAWDSDSGRLLASAGSLNPSESGIIAAIDPGTGQVTVLNANAPNIVGIAALTTPEPGSFFLLVTGSIACLATRWTWRQGFTRNNGNPAGLKRQTESKAP